MPPDGTIVDHPPEAVRASREWAGFYRDKGYNPVPSRPEEKRPFLRWSEWLDKPVPGSLFDRFDTANIQVMTGRRWGLMVIDLDGPEAIDHWPAMGPTIPRTWITHSGGEGRHLWFSVDPDGPPIPSGRLWGIWEPDAREARVDWAKHKAVEVLGDRKLVMAPPSIHPRTGRKYRFIAGHSPREVARPAMAPRWVLGLPRLVAPRRSVEAPSRVLPERPVRPATGRFDRDEVLDSIGDKIALAQSWGLRFASYTANQSGWCPCHAIDRDDRSPSASFRADSGHYWEPDSGTISLFDLSVRLGIYRDWKEAVQELGERFHARPITRDTRVYPHAQGSSLPVLSLEFNSIDTKGKTTLRANVGAYARSQYSDGEVSSS